MDRMESTMTGSRLGALTGCLSFGRIEKGYMRGLRIWGTSMEMIGRAGWGIRSFFGRVT